MEDDLDEIANGIQEAVPWLSRFYFGLDRRRRPGLKEMVNDRLGEIDARAINSIPLGVTADGEPVVARVGKNGPYLQCGEKSRSIRDDMAPDELTLEKAIELLDTPDDRRRGSRSRDRPRGAGPQRPFRSLRATRSRRPGQQDQAEERVVAVVDVARDHHARRGAQGVVVAPRVGCRSRRQRRDHGAERPVRARTSRRATTAAASTSEEQLFTLTLDEALAVLAEPKRRRGQGEAKGPLREIGADPDTGKPIVAKDGRFGVYVTDGETNASLRKGDMVETLTLERACELLAERRAGCSAAGQARPWHRRRRPRLARRPSGRKRRPRRLPARPRRPRRRRSRRRNSPRTRMVRESSLFAF